MRYKILKKKIKYTGRELRPHFNLEQTKIYGSLITAFIGECDVKTPELVDMEDRLAGDHIKAKSMLHMIGEFFGTSLEAGVLYQRLLIAHVERILSDARHASAISEKFEKISRHGDDLMVGDKKLTVSIATATPVCVLVHWGINIDPKGAPVKAIGLDELKWDEIRVLKFAEEVLMSFTTEVKDIQIALCKVKPVYA